MVTFWSSLSPQVVLLEPDFGTMGSPSAPLTATAEKPAPLLPCLLPDHSLICASVCALCACVRVCACACACAWVGVGVVCGWVRVWAWVCVRLCVRVFGGEPHCRSQRP